MEIITIDNNNYILGDYILINAPIYSKGCRSSRDLVRIKKIEASKFIYVKKVNDIWIKTEGKSVKFDKVIIKEDIIKVIPELNNKNQIINDDNGIEKAPDIIHLNDDEKFKDNDGNILNIETRGERETNKIYFRVKNVAEGFHMEFLQNIIIKENTLYRNNIDYKYYICEKKNSIENNSSNKTSKKSDLSITNIKKELFLTYEGMLRVLFVSRNNKTTNFIKWATNTLFTCQLGSVEQKQCLTSNILGVSIKAVKEVFNKNVSTIPSIYLLNLNTVDKLRTTFNIPITYSNDMIVCKFGCTKNIESRIKEHQNTYGKINNVELNLLMFSYIDPQFIFDAETNIKDFLYQYLYKYESYNELVIINPKQLKQIKNQFDMIQNCYSGHIKELLLQMKELENKLTLTEATIKINDANMKTNEEKYKNEINEYKNKNEILILQHKNELQSKNIEVLEYKLKLLEK